MNFIFNSFQLLDYILSVIIILIVLTSILKGFIQSILGLLTWIGSIILTLNFFASLGHYISAQLTKIDFLSEWNQLTEIIGIVISIPLIFIISLLILRKIRKLVSNDLDKATLGIILDKSFGLLYGFLFSYIIFSTLLYFLGSFNENYLFSHDLYNFLIHQSIILKEINNFNNYFIIPNIPFFVTNNL